MHGSLAQNKVLLDTLVQRLAPLTEASFAVCLPHTYLFQAQALLQGTNIAWGAQNISKYDVGPMTGEISASMVQDFGCEYVIVGHSERNGWYCETNEHVAMKFAAALQAGLTPIVCIGESQEERASGVTEQVIGRRLDAVINTVGVHALANAVISYEPKWAIGTGITATPEQAQTEHAFLRKRVAALDPEVAKTLKIVYGGSVKPSNASQLFAMPDIDGGLIGRCALNVDEFEAICRAACR